MGESRVFAVGTVDRVMEEMTRDVVGDGPAMLETALMQVVGNGLPAIGLTSIKGPYGLAIPVSIAARPAVTGIAVDVAIHTVEGSMECRVEEHEALGWSASELAKWAQGVWDDTVAAVVGGVCRRTAERLGEMTRRSSAVFTA